jgi:hypothetical protein
MRKKRGEIGKSPLRMARPPPGDSLLYDGDGGVRYKLHR